MIKGYLFCCPIQLLLKSMIKLYIRIESSTEGIGTWQDYFPSVFAEITTNFGQPK